VLWCAWIVCRCCEEGESGNILQEEEEGGMGQRGGELQAYGDGGGGEPLDESGGAHDGRAELAVQGGGGGQG